VLPHNGSLGGDMFSKPVNKKLNGSTNGHSNGWHNGDQSSVTRVNGSDSGVEDLSLNEKDGFLPRRRDEHDVDFS
jgi:hypothetical protein